MKKVRSNKLIFIMIALFISVFFYGCGKGADKNTEVSTDSSSSVLEDGSGNGSGQSTENAVKEPLYDRAFLRNLDLQYAKEFSAAFYEGGLILIKVGEDSFLLVDEGADIPEAAKKDEKSGKITILQKPLSNIYNASSSVMDHFLAIDALDRVTMTSTKAEDWSIEEVRKLVEDDTISYVGKYSMPDYEYILDDGCSLAIENQMIYHSPDTKEKLEALEIPVLVERSSLEDEPLGRLEWIKLYGILTGEEEAAQAVFDAQQKKIEEIQEELGKDSTGEKLDAALFYIGNNGIVGVRNPDDYMTTLLKMAGAEYSFDHLSGDSSKTYIQLQMEEFYAHAIDADVLIYNSNFGYSPTNIDELIAIDGILAELKAVKNKNVWCYSQDSFQQPTKMADMVKDYYEIFKYVRDGGEEPELMYFERLK
ncbi:MAG: ABC transporter substrate-binding protein [Eubacterium sp.]|nr:ABC transporter substrate-binding protein [Eubacterium sp.]